MDDTRINLLTTEKDVDVIGSNYDNCKLCNKYCITERCGVYMAIWNVVFIGLLIIAIILGILKLMNKI